MLSSNQVLHEGRYRIIEQFGQEDSGVFYEAYDTVSDSKVVLRESSGLTGKVATPAQLESVRSAFANDAKRLTEIDHPALLKVKDYFSDIDRQYLVMESCDGSVLADILNDEDRTLAISDTLRWSDQLLDLLDYLHSRTPSIIHENINPRNIRVTSSYKVKLLAAGSGRTSQNDPDIADDNSESPDIAYRALEQLWLGLDSASQKVIANSLNEHSEELLRRPPDARTDIYSVGAVLYYLLTRTKPADALARTIDMLDGNDDPLQRPDAVDPSIATDLSDAVMKAMELKREDRFESATTMRQILLSVSSATVKPNPFEERYEAPPTGPKTVNADTADAEIERLGFDRERMELEAEQKRLDDARNRIEQKRSALEAEEKRRAEETLKQTREAEEKLKSDRLAKEARDAEEKRTTERLAKEKRLAEARQIEAERSAAVLKKPSETETDIFEPGKDDLLELPEHEAAVIPHENFHADVFALDAESVHSSPKVTFENDDIFSHPAKGPGIFQKPAVMAAAAAGLLIAVAGMWFMLGSNPSTVAPAASVQSVPAANTTATSTGTDTPPQAEESNPGLSNSTTPAPGSVETPAVTAKVDAKAESEAAKQKAKKQAALAAKPTPEKKKAVTVDDLINDN